jgi:hypothetical protein
LKGNYWRLCRLTPTEKLVKAAAGSKKIPKRSRMGYTVKSINLKDSIESIVILSHDEMEKSFLALF